jgi:hypothetical protein
LAVESSDRIISVKVIIEAREDIPVDQQVKIADDIFLS